MSYPTQLRVTIISPGATIWTINDISICKRIEWRLGYPAYEHIETENEGWLEVVIDLEQTSGLENFASLTEIRPGALVTVDLNLGTFNIQRLFRGGVIDIRWDFDKREMRIYVRSVLWQLRGQMVRTPLLQDADIGDLWLAIQDQVRFIVSLMGNYFQLDVHRLDENRLYPSSGWGQFDTVTNFAVLDSGFESTFDWLGDTLGGGVNGYELLRQMAENEGGAIFTNRSGLIAIKKRGYASTGRAETLDGTNMASIEYDYGSRIVTRSFIRFTPRYLGAVNTILWELDAPIPIFVGHPHPLVLECVFTDENGQRVGTRNFNPPVVGGAFGWNANLSKDGTGFPGNAWLLVEHVQSTASSVTFRFTNTIMSQTIWLQPGTRITGTPLLQGDEQIVEHIDYASENKWGVRAKNYNLSLVVDAATAFDLVNYHTSRQNLPFPVARKAVISDLTAYPALTVDAFVLAAGVDVGIVDADRGVDEDYRICAVHHRLTPQAWRVELDLEYI